MDRSPNFNRKDTLEKLGIAIDDKIAVVLGRLFKFHPEFDVAIVGILLATIDKNSTIVLILEDILEWNDIIYNRIKSCLVATLMNNDLTTNILISGEGRVVEEYTILAMDILFRHLRLVGYHYYGEVLLVADVALDTFPYGGKRMLMLMSD